jgi:hypothetical protein
MKPRCPECNQQIQLGTPCKHCPKIDHFEQVPVEGVSDATLFVEAIVGRCRGTVK